MPKLRGHSSFVGDLFQCQFVPYTIERRPAGHPTAILPRPLFATKCLWGRHTRVHGSCGARTCERCLMSGKLIGLSGVFNRALTLYGICSLFEVLAAQHVVVQCFVAGLYGAVRCRAYYIPGTHFLLVHRTFGLLTRRAGSICKRCRPGSHHWYSSALLRWCT